MPPFLLLSYKRFIQGILESAKAATESVSGGAGESTSSAITAQAATGINIWAHEGLWRPLASYLLFSIMAYSFLVKVRFAVPAFLRLFFSDCTCHLCKT